MVALLGSCAPLGPLSIHRETPGSRTALSVGKGQVSFVIKEAGRKIDPSRLHSIQTEVKTKEGRRVMEGLNVTDIISSGPKVARSPVVGIALEKWDDGKLILIQREGSYRRKVTAVRPGNSYWITLHATSRIPDTERTREAQSEACLITVH